MAYIVGISRQSGILRMVALERNLKRLAVAGWAEAALPPSASADDAAGAAAKLQADNGWDAGMTVYGTPTSRAMFRRLSFPFTQAAKIRQVLPLEMEASLPLTADDIAADMVFSAPQGDETGREVLAAALPWAHLEGILDSHARAGLEVAGVDLNASGVLAAARLAAENLPDRALLLDITSKSGSVVLLWDGHPRLLREWTGTSPDAETVAREVNLSLAAADLPPGEAPAMVLLAGEMAELTPATSGFAGALALALNMDVKPLRLATPNLAGEAPPPRYAAALGLALRGAGKADGFNFHAQGKLARGAGLDLRRHLPAAAVVAAVLALGFGLISGTDIYLKQQRLEAIQGRIEQEVAQALPEVAGRFSRMQYVSILRSRVHELRQSLAATSGDATTTTAVLARLATSVPPKLPMRLSTVSLDENAIRVSGQSDAFGTVEAIARSLGQAPEFAEVNIRGAAAATSGKGVDFQLEIIRNQGVRP